MRGLAEGVAGTRVAVQAVHPKVSNISTSEATDEEGSRRRPHCQGRWRAMGEKKHTAASKKVALRAHSLKEEQQWPSAPCVSR